MLLVYTAKVTYIFSVPFFPFLLRLASQNVAETIQFPLCSFSQVFLAFKFLLWLSSSSLVLSRFSIKLFRNSQPESKKGSSRGYKNVTKVKTRSAFYHIFFHLAMKFSSLKIQVSPRKWETRKCTFGILKRGLSLVLLMIYETFHCVSKSSLEQIFW